jgi:NAD+ kinase
VLIRRCDYHLNLIHPKDYSYFNTLSSKLGWSKNCSDFASSTLLYKTSLYCMKTQLWFFIQENNYAGTTDHQQLCHCS